MASITGVTDKALGAALAFILIAVVVMPFFNTAYNTSITGLSSATSQGLLLVVFLIYLVSHAKDFIGRK